MSPQSYPISSQFTSDDFNLLANDINEIVGIGAGDSGYGQDQLFVNHVNKGQRLLKKNWMELFYAMTFSAAHQGTTLTTPSNIFEQVILDMDKTNFLLIMLIKGRDYLKRTGWNFFMQ